MKVQEIDKFAEEYLELHARNIRLSGETPEFFAEYKVRDMADALSDVAQPSKILDFGGGIGVSVPYVSHYFPNARLTCLDVSRRSLDLARQRLTDRAEFVHFDGETIPYEAASFDLCFASCVFHHIGHDRHAPLMREIRRVLKPRGAMFVFEHNPLNPLTLHAVNTCAFDENARLIPAWKMKACFRDAGFGEIACRYRIFFPGALRSFRPLERWMTWLPAGAQYYVFGRPAQ